MLPKEKEIEKEKGTNIKNIQQAEKCPALGTTSTRPVPTPRNPIQLQAEEGLGTSSPLQPQLTHDAINSPPPCTNSFKKGSGKFRGWSPPPAWSHRSDLTLRSTRIPDCPGQDKLPWLLGDCPSVPEHPHRGGHGWMHIRFSRAPVLGLPAALKSPRLQSWLVFSFIKQKTHVPQGLSKHPGIGHLKSMGHSCQRGKLSLGGDQYPVKLPGAPAAIKIARLYKN